MFYCFHSPTNSDMDYGIFNVRTDVNAWDCAQGSADTVRESALKVDSGRKNPLPHRGIEPASAACRSDALPIELHPHPENLACKRRKRRHIHLRASCCCSIGGGGIFSLARIWGECSTFHSPPALFFFNVEISLRTLIPIFRPGSVHSGSAN